MKLEVAFVCEDCGLRAPCPKPLETTGHRCDHVVPTKDGSMMSLPSHAHTGWIPLPEPFLGCSGPRCRDCQEKWLEKMRPIWSAQDLKRKKEEREKVKDALDSHQALAEHLRQISAMAHDVSCARRRLEALIGVLETTV